MTRRAWRGALVAAVVVQLLVLYWPQPVGPEAPPGLDKVAHAAVFAAVALTGRAAGVPVVWLAVVLLVHAVLSEVLQESVLPARSGDPWDVAADVVGTVVGLALPLARPRSAPRGGRMGPWPRRRTGGRS